MKLKKKILDIVGEFLKKHGFTYDTVESGTGIHFFTKEVGAITQKIYVQKSPYTKELYLRYETTAWGSGPGGDAFHLVPKGVYRFNSMAFMEDQYKNEEELEKILKEFVEIIEKYVLSDLDRLSIEEEIIPTREMGTKLFSSHQALSERFIKEYDINVNGDIKDNASTWLTFVEEKIIETKHLPYEDVQDMLVEMAAFLGEQLIKEIGGTWTVGRDPRHVYVKGIKTQHPYTMAYSALALIVKSWEKQNGKFFKSGYLSIVESKL